MTITLPVDPVRRIGPGAPCFIIAEAGVNHNGQLPLARQLIDAAADAGADAVKFQTFQAEAVISVHAPQAAYQRANTGTESSQLDLVRPYQLSYEQHLELRDYARERGILFLSTAHDAGSIAWLERLDMPAYKVGSADVTNVPYLERVARVGRPVLLSTGMSTLAEVERAVETLRASGGPPLLIFHCVSNYPTGPADCNLRAMDTLRAAFGVPVGFSDHTLGLAVPVAAAARGANALEKHLTLDQSLPGPDHAASLEPGQFAQMVAMIRAAEAALGDGIKRVMPSEADTRRVARKSLVAARDLPAGTVLDESVLAVKRPGTGLGPDLLAVVVGRALVRPLAADELLSWEHLLGQGA